MGLLVIVSDKKAYSRLEIEVQADGHGKEERGVKDGKDCEEACAREEARKDDAERGAMRRDTNPCQAAGLGVSFSPR